MAKHSLYVYFWDGPTPLHIAAMYCNLNSIYFLLNNGADINATNNTGLTTLLIAAKSKSNCDKIDTVELLLDNGAILNNADIASFSSIQDDEIKDILLKKLEEQNKK